MTERKGSKAERWWAPGGSRRIKHPQAKKGKARVMITGEMAGCCSERVRRGVELRCGLSNLMVGKTGGGR